MMPDNCREYTAEALLQAAEELSGPCGIERYLELKIAHRTLCRLYAEVSAELERLAAERAKD